MSLVISKTKSNLVRSLLASSVLMASSYSTVGQGLTVTILAANTTEVATNGDSYLFAAGTSKLNVPNGVGLGNFLTPLLDLSVGAIVADATVNFVGDSVVGGGLGVLGVNILGLGVGLPLNVINFNGGLGETVAVAGATFANTLNFNGAGTTTLTKAAAINTANFNAGSTTNFTAGLTALNDLDFTGIPVGQTANVTGAIEGDNLLFTNGTVNFADAVKANGALIVDGPSTTNFNNGLTATGNLDFTGVAAGQTATIGGAAGNVQGKNLLIQNGTVNFTPAVIATGNANFTGASTSTFTGGLIAAGNLDFSGVGAGLTANVGGAGLVKGANLILQDGNTAFTAPVQVTGSTAATGAGTATFGAAFNQTGGNATFSNDSKANFNLGADFAGNLTLNNNAIVTLDTGTITGSLNIKNAAEAIFNDNYKVTTNLNISATGTVQVATGKILTVSGALVDGAAGSELIFDFGNTAIAGKIAVTGNANINATQTVTLQQVNLGAFALGTSSQNIVTAAAGIVGKPALTAPSNLFVSFALDASAPTALKLIATRTAPSGLGDNTAGVGGVLAGVTNGNASGALVDLVNGLGGMTDIEAQSEALESVAPLIDGAMSEAVLAVQNNTFDLFSRRIAELRAGLDTYHTGYAAGYKNDVGQGTWVKLFGNHADQKERDDVDGYKAETWGIAAGTDMMIADRIFVGAALNWASIDVNHDLNSGDTDINSYQASIYGGWNMRGPMYFNWMASAAYNDYETTRHTIAGAFNQTTLADYNGWQYGARGELGYVFGEHEFHITPNVALTYSHVDFDNYREKGVSTANQFVNYGDIDAFWAGIGVKVSYDRQWHRSRVSPEAHINIAYDLIGDKASSNSQFVTFGPAYETLGASPARADYNLGFSLTTWGDSGLGLSIAYDLNLKSDYHAHSGFVRVRYEW